MNILTKICVVALVVLAIFVSIVAITQANAPVNYREAYLQELQRSQMAQQTAVNHMLVASSLNSANAELKRTIATLENDMASSSGRDKSEIKRLLVELAAEKEKVTQRDTTITSLTGQLDFEAKAHGAAEERANDLLKNTGKLQSDVAGLEAAIAKLALENDTFKKLVQNKDIANKDLEEQLADRDAKLDAAAAGKTTPDAAVQTVQAPADLSGKVTAVKDDIASVNIGSAKDVKKGMLLTIYRGSKFVAHLRVQMVELTESSGVIVDKLVEPQQGDLVRAANRQ